MDYNEINNKLKEIDIEDHIWLIYVGIILLSWYSNSLERKYFIYNDLDSKDKYRKIIILIFSILVIVYIYFFQSSIDDIHFLKSTDSIKKVKLTELSAIGSLLIVISGLIFLYIAYTDQDIDVEIAFN
jgi:hypothetical protein